MQPLHTLDCPSCGAAHNIYNPGITTVSCEYCGTTFYWDTEKIEDKGKHALLPEGFSRFYTGGEGTIQTRPFTILGRARYSFGKGFWDEWYIIYSDTNENAWLSEDNHEFSLETVKERVKLPEYEKLRPGVSLKLKESAPPFIIDEVGEAECIGIEGSLPKEIAVGETYRFADGSTPDGTMTLGIEYDAEEPTLFTGVYLPYEEIRMQDEGADW